MRVTAWTNGQDNYGIRIGAPNRAHYFRQDWTDVEIEIDGVAHSLPLTGGFWRSCPEIRGRAVTQWLHLNRLTHWPLRQPPALELEPLGDNRFRLLLAEQGAQPALQLRRSRARAR